MSWERIQWRSQCDGATHDPSLSADNVGRHCDVVLTADIELRFFECQPIMSGPMSGVPTLSADNFGRDFDVVLTADIITFFECQPTMSGPMSGVPTLSADNVGCHCDVVLTADIITFFECQPTMSGPMSGCRHCRLTLSCVEGNWASAGVHFHDIIYK